MCELCNMRQKLNKKISELNFRFEQYQRDIEVGRREQALDAQERALVLIHEVFDDLDKYTIESLKDEYRTQHESGMEIDLERLMSGVMSKKRKPN